MVMIKKKLDKSCMPDWSGKLCKVVERRGWCHTLLEDGRPVDPQTMYKLSDPTND